jgi:hypothetical protein
MVAMHKLLITAISLALLSAPVMAQVDQKIHKLGIEAKDYEGCVRAMKGSTQPVSRQITSQGADIAEGSQCTADFAYIGGENCQDVRCEYNSSGFNALGHDGLIAGKKDNAGNDVWGCTFSFWQGTGVLRLTGSITRTINNKDCPPGEPRLGYNNTCQTASKDWMLKAVNKN